MGNNNDLCLCYQMAMLLSFWILMAQCSQTINYMIKISKCELFYFKQYQFTYYNTHNIPLNSEDVQLFGCSWQHYLFKNSIQLDNKCCPTIQCGHNDNLCNINKTPINGQVYIHYHGRQYQCQVWLLNAHKALKKCANCFFQHCKTIRACYYGSCY